FFKKKYNIDVFTGYEVLNINSLEKNITVKNLHTNEVFKDTYDKLVLATGASPFMPNIKGIENKNVFFLRNVQSARNIKNFIINNKPKNAVIVGTG
ncbi:FAD-dependent oxidoreductase, partial [Clostridium sp. ZBS15]